MGHPRNDESSRKERQLVYLICAVLVLAGIVLVLVSQLLPAGVASSVLLSLGTALLPLGLLSGFFEYYLQRSWATDSKKLGEDILNRLDTISAEVRDGSRPEIAVVAEDLGITQMFPNRNAWMSAERQDLYNNASGLIRSLSVSFYLYEPFSGERMIEGLVDLVKRGKRFQILVCNPNSPFVSRFYALRKPEDIRVVDDFRTAIVNSLDWLGKARDIIEDAGFKNKIRVRVYDKAPGCYMQVIDGTAIFYQPYLYGSDQADPPLLRIEQKSPEGIMVARHFQVIWDEADDFQP